MFQQHDLPELVAWGTLDRLEEGQMQSVVAEAFGSGIDFWKLEMLAEEHDKTVCVQKTQNAYRYLTLIATNNPRSMNATLLQ